MTKKSFIAMTTLVIVAVAVWFVWLRPPKVTPPPMPNPNGYDNFVQAGKLLTGVITNVTTASKEELQAHVERNQAALKLVRKGLAHGCRVPIMNSVNYLNTHFSELANLRSLGRALKAEGRLAELEQRTNKATSIYLEILQLSHESVRGGLLVDGTMCQAIEQNGFSGLQPLPPFLDALACRETIKALDKFESKRESVDETVRQENEWVRKTFGFIRITSLKIVSAVANRPSPLLNPASVNFIKLDKDLRRQTGLLLIDLAARAFELEKGRRPKSAKELVPDYLKAVPKDPTTGADLALPR